MKRTKGFTLVELLCVAGIIVLLVGILVPSLGKAKALARRRVCSTNLAAIAKGGFSYAIDYNGMFPTAPAVMYTGGGSRNNWSVQIGANYRSAAPTVTSNNVPVSASLFLLIRGSQAPAGAFLCPEVGGTAPETGTAPKNFDFAGPTTFTYSFLMPYGKQLITSGRGASIAYGADRSPYFDPTTGTTVAGATPATDKNGNSKTHSGDGQNVAFLDGRAAWFDTPLAGLYNDNIYTRYDNTYDANKMASDAGNMAAAQKGVAANNEVVTNEGDSALWP